MLTLMTVIDTYRKPSTNRRQRTINFCRGVLNGRNRQICSVIEEQNFSKLNIGGMELTKETFDASFKHVCKELFRIRPVSVSYIIPIFGYALQLDDFLYGKDWYYTDLLVWAITDVLIENGFDVTTRSKCILL